MKKNQTLKQWPSVLENYYWGHQNTTPLRRWQGGRFVHPPPVNFIIFPPKRDRFREQEVEFFDALPNVILPNKATVFCSAFKEMYLVRISKYCKLLKNISLRWAMAGTNDSVIHQNNHLKLNHGINSLLKLYENFFIMFIKLLVHQSLSQYCKSFDIFD